MTAQRVFVLCGLLSLAVVTSAAAAPLITAEFSIDTAPVSGPAANEQSRPVVAFGAGQYLLAWVDDRQEKGFDIFGVRIKPDGTVLDPTNLKLATLPHPVSDLTLASDGTGFMLVFNHQFSGAQQDDQINAMRINASGQPLDTSPIVLFAEAHDQRNPAVTSDGTQWLVAWQTSIGQAARVSKSGQVLDSVPLAVPAFGFAVYPLGAAFNGTDFVLGYENTLVRISPAGLVREPMGISHSGYTESLACDTSTGTCAAFNANGGGVWGVRFSKAGSVLDAMPQKIATPGTAQLRHGDAAAGFADGRFTVTYREYSNSAFGEKVRAVLVTPALQAIGNPFDVVSTSKEFFSPQVATGTGAGALAVWDSYTDVYAARLNTSTGTLSDAQPLLASLGRSAQSMPATASDGTQALVVWQDLREGTYTDIYAARVTPAGTVLDVAPVAVASTVDGDDDPAVTFGANQFLVAWYNDESGLQAQRLSRTATKTGNPIQIDPAFTTSGGHPALAFDGTQFQLVYEGGTHLDICLKRINSTGVVLDTTPIVLHHSAHYLLSPSIACDGTNCLVAWLDDNLQSFGAAGAMAVRVDKMGQMLDAQPFLLGLYEEPTLAFDGTNYVAVSAGYGDEINAVRISKAGVVLDVPAKKVSDDGSSPTLTWDGTRYFVGFQRFYTPYTQDLFGQWLSPALGLLTPQPVQLSSTTAVVRNPSAVALPQGRALIAYSTYDATPQFNAPRLRARVVAPDGAAMPCTAASQCASGFCVDGVCCDSTCGAGNANDCQACSVSAGALLDGVCSALSSSVVCRASTGTCDVAEHCDGLAKDCPADLFSPEASACDGPADCPTALCEQGACQPTTLICQRPDAGELLPDAGMTEPFDAGAHDSADAGPDSTSVPNARIEEHAEAGCGCAHSGAPTLLLFWGSALAWAVARRRR